VESPASGVSDANKNATVFAILSAISLSHLLNDTIQSLLPAIYPVLKNSFSLTFAQVGLITFVFQLTASLLQPVVGIYTDRRPMPYSLTIGMGASLCGLLLLSVASSYPVLLLAAALVGTGSSIFHPESSRVARMASGGRHGFAQSFFQVGGNVGSALGPLLAASIVVPGGQRSIAWFSIVALVGMIVLWNVGGWYKQQHRAAAKRPPAARTGPALSRARIVGALVVLVALIFSKFFYMASLSSYYTFYVIEKFGVSVQHAQVLLFVFLAAVAGGTLVGGPLGDRFGRKYVIWVSILGILPFTLALPHVGLAATVVLTVIIGFGLASAFPAIIVFAQELMPGKIGTVSGIFFGLAFGMGGLGAAALGALADKTSIIFVYHVTAFLPAIGLLTIFLPNIEGPMTRRRKPTVEPVAVKPSA
jgi:FSR family fosmidomycin resistance protein-like MFS transporter